MEVRRWLAAAAVALVLVGLSLCQPTMYIGSKSDPRAHLFSYDQKWRESTDLQVNVPRISDSDSGTSPVGPRGGVSMTAQKRFWDCRRLSTYMDLRALPDWVEIIIAANFTGVGQMGYTVFDPETGDPKEQMSRIDHMFIGNFTMDEHLRVVKDHREEKNYLCPGGCPV
ncbi:MAG: hypothetical protein A4E45_00079 [Methanosaeta sp. PtaB.Bin039]|nr:MAG: hypothetical protein A4E45_00079 [Methanosaeta sp. PtaB.Bin039]OPY47605.1 MAG: hypothetical protein A4E47_00199 [Methanosaeta sp. PtaU1.Bin028]HOT06890.1 hypothetical protein [Methanotrichaceae archaeon]HQF16488.1 hypothetical protein [Methanotrichaceae archaeon]HQI91911.1 hypothetical protein [Methanotrichaceae archaeon]